MTYTIERTTNTALYKDEWFTLEQLSFHFSNCSEAATLALMLASSDENARREAKFLNSTLIIVK